MTAPSTRSHSQAKPEASGSSQLKSSGFHSKSSGEGESQSFVHVMGLDVAC